MAVVLSASVTPAEPESGNTVVCRIYARDALTGVLTVLTTAPTITLIDPLGTSNGPYTATQDTTDSSWYYLYKTVVGQMGQWNWTWSGVDPVSSVAAQSSGYFITRDTSGV